jgi:peptidoglycan/LPS O-acetylase OafA/YrhL
MRMRSARIKLADVCRLTARIFGTGMVALAVYFLLGEHGPKPHGLTPGILVIFIGLGLASLALLAAWRWELAGALVALAGWALASVALCVLSGTGPFGLMGFAPWGIAALFFLASVLLRRGQEGKQAGGPDATKGSRGQPLES